jgi:hypothetical protein
MPSIEGSTGNCTYKKRHIAVKIQGATIEADILFPDGDSRFSEMISSEMIPQTKAEWW